VSASYASIPLRLLLAVLLATSSLWTAAVAARRERDDGKSVCITARAAVRLPAGAGSPDFPPPAAALPSAAPSLSSAPILAAPDLTPDASLAPARPRTYTPPARAPPLPA